jgi:hypothetical protein
MILERLAVSAADFERRTGWEIKPEGACKGERCVPLPESDGSTLDAEALSERLGMALVHDEGHGLWALGPESGGGTLLTAELPELSLPSRDGTPFAIRSLRGQKVLLVAWASW